MNARYPVPQHKPRNPAAQSRIVSNRPTARFGSSTFAITFGATTSGTASAPPYRLGVIVAGSTNQFGTTKASPPAGYPARVHPAEKSRRVYGPTARVGSSTFAITFGATTSGAASATRLTVARAGTTNQWSVADAPAPQSSPAAVPRPEKSRIVYTPVARVGSSTFAITFGASTSGSSGSTVYRLGNAVAGGTNQWGVVKQAPQYQAASVEFGSRGFVYYNAAPPIYRLILPGGTNQGFQFQAVVQPPPVLARRPRIVTGATARAGSSTFQIIFGATTAGTVPGAGKNRLLMGVGQ